MIAAVVVGGAAIAGGRGTLTGTLLGVILLAAIGPALMFLGVERVLGACDSGRRSFSRRSRPMPARPPRLPRAAERRLGLHDDERRHRGRHALVPERRMGPAARARRRDRCSSPRSRRISSRVGNFFEITRLSVELGLLAVALTPVIVAGGIDLSVGAMMGLAAVVFGAAVTDWHLGRSRPRPRVRSLVGCAGGALNALLDRAARAFRR